MFNTILKLITILFAATACMAGYPCAASAQHEPHNALVVGGE
jgi:hypothetical protein